MLEPTRDTRHAVQPESSPSTGDTATPETRPGGSDLPFEPPFDGTASDIPGRYIDLRPHAKGGLGEVYRGRDAELNWPVAVKRIQARHADNADARARFLLEAEVTARLEHPGVVPVYGLVQAEDGQPCYAMRFIQGELLHDAIVAYHETQPAASASERDRSPARLRSRLVDRSLAFRQLLTRFIALCNTVAYAHSRGIIHRDLKPHNVMLGNYGETLLVDWGLARPVGRSEEQRTISEELTLMPTAESGSATRTGQAVGTPAFMSPEQAAGNWAAVGPASDVYSLGATLYVLLTGKSPFKGGWADIQQKIQRGEFERPRSVKAGVPPTLEAICLRAMAVKPADRYADGKALAADVEQWLADEPVSAYPEPFRVRARRWMRKHPGRVAAAVATVLVGLVSLGIGVALIGEKNRELENANSELRTFNERLDDANGKLEKGLASEKAARKLADERYTMALDAFKQQVFDADDLLKNRPGTRDLRDRLQKRAIEGLRKLAASADKTQSADRTRAGAHMALGDIYLTIDGEVAKAAQEYATAHEVLQRLADADPKDTQAQRDLWASSLKIGDVVLQQGEVGKALEQYQAGLAISKRLADADPKDAQAQRDLSRSHEKIGNVLLQQGAVGKALEQYQAGLAISKRLADADPKDAQAQRDLSISHDRIGDVLRRQGKVGKALEQYQAGLAIRKRLADADPKDAQAQRGVSVSHEEIGDVVLQQGEGGKALEQYQAGLAIRKRLAEADPKDAQAQRDLSVSCDRIGDVLLLRQGEVGKALEQYQAGLAIRQRLADADPKDARAQRDLSVSQSKIGGVLLEQGEVGKALELYQAGLAIRQRLADADPKDAQAQRDLSFSRSGIGDVVLQQGEVGKALEQYQAGLAISKRLADADPKDAQAQRDLWISFKRIGDVLLQQREVGKALEHYQAGLAISKRLADADPKDAQAQRDLSISHDKIGDVLRQQGDFGKALEHYQAAITKRLADADPKDAQAQRDLSISHDRIGDILLRQGEVGKALERYQAGLAIRQRLADADPRDAEAQRGLFVSYFNFGSVHKADQEFARAAEWFEKGRTVLLPWHEKKLLTGKFKNIVPVVDREIALCRLAEKAIADLDFALKQPPVEVPGLLVIRFKYFVKKADRASLVATAEAYGKLAEKDDKHIYNTACAWSLASGLAKEDVTLREEYAGKALALLRKTPNGKGHFVDSPAKLAAHMKKDRDLDPLREREDFKKLLAELEKK